MFLVAGCAAPKPSLYPNAHLQQVGEAAANRDIDECCEMAKDAGATASQGKSGQVAGSTAAGGAIGSVPAQWSEQPVVRRQGSLRGLFRCSLPSNASKQFVQRCLKESGYDLVGWK